MTFFTFPFKKSKLFLNLLFFLFLRYLLAFNVVFVIAIKKSIYSCQFFDFCEICQLRFQGLRYLFLYKSNLFAIYVVIFAILAIVIWVFFGATKFHVTFAIFADLNTRFLQAISIKPIFSKIATRICSKVLLQFAILVKCYFRYICYFFYTFLTVHLIFFCQNCQINLLPKFGDSVQSQT